jgi:hypothetical protein
MFFLVEKIVQKNLCEMVGCQFYVRRKKEGS